MTGRPWYAHYVQDYRRDTAKLTILQHGAYRLLLDEYYATGQPLPANADDLHRVCRALAADEHAAIAFILSKFFILKEDGYHQTRADFEIEKADEISAKRSKSARSRHKKRPANARAKAHANGTAKNEHLHTQSHTQSQLEDSSLRDVSASADVIVLEIPKAKKKAARAAYARDFEEFWTNYPTDRLMSKKETATAWGKISDEDRLAARAAIPAFRAYCAANPTYRPVHAVRFLTQRRFDGFAAPAVSANGGDPKLRAMQDAQTKRNDEFERELDLARAREREKHATH